MVSDGLSVVLKKRLADFELDVGWRVGPGFTVLFGYSGSGKSLTLAMLTGVMRPDEGRICFKDKTLVDTESGIFVPAQKRGFGYVPQTCGLFPHLTVKRNIAFGLHALPPDEREARIAQVLESFELTKLADKYPRKLSGGQRQRAALARALAPKPRALILDEPLSALDLPVRAEMRTLLRGVQKEENIPILMVTHDLYEAVTLADTLVVYSGTGIVQTGSPQELINDPATPEIRRLVRSMPIPIGEGGPQTVFTSERSK